MSAVTAPTPPALRSMPWWLVPGGLILLSLVPAIAGTARLAQLATATPVTPDNARFVSAPMPVTLHIVAAILYSMIGAFQLSPTVRRRHRALHRSLGRIAIPAAMVVAMSGLWMTFAYVSPPGDGQLVFLERVVFGSAMLLALTLGINAIRQRNFASHGAWMIRAYAIGLGAGTQVLTHIPWFILAEGRPGETPRAVMMGAGWLINVVVAEWVIRTSRP